MNKLLGNNVFEAANAVESLCRIAAFSDEPDFEDGKKRKVSLAQAKARPS